ncbi:hypothetical protein GCM10010420_35790 [Streptomyces glaucosporus]|uniref:DDE Tnp4 domain-containing protein n=1 Tax=Streptomyces glaucosporus TaxID=284044 RepID=A0ABP5VM45_9ACTN
MQAIPTLFAAGPGASPSGKLLWVSPALPGAVHGLCAARTHWRLSSLWEHHRHPARGGSACWADKVYRGARPAVRVPSWGRWGTLSAGQQAHNRSHARIRALGEQAVAAPKSWRLRKPRCSTTRITGLVKAVLTLHLAASA